jgi:hypothetical protein
MQILIKTGSIVLLCMCFIVSGNAYAESCQITQQWQKIELKDEELLIAALRVNTQTVAASLELYSIDDTQLIPLTLLDNLLQLGWEVDLIKQRLEYTEADEAGLCTFSIQLGAGETGWYWAQDDFDIYLDVRALDSLLSASHNFDYALQQITFQTELKLKGLLPDAPTGFRHYDPVQQIQADRIIGDQYHLATPPLINYKLRSNYDSVQKSTSSQLNLVSFFDLFNHATELRINKSEQNSRQFLKFSKDLDVSGSEEAINFLRYEAGDIQLQSNELISRSKQAAGVRIFNFDPNYSRSFSTVTIEEIALPGWRAQLFRNGQFVREVFSDENSRVVFPEVDTFYGNNLFEIKLYGPEGQQEVRQQNINVGSEQLNPGRINYEFSVSDASKHFIDDDVAESRYDKNIAGLLSYGLSQHTTIELAAQSLSGLEVQQDFISTGVLMTLDNYAIKSQWVKDLDGGDAFFAGLNAGFGRSLKVNFSARYLNDFVSDAYTPEMDLKAEGRVRLSGRSDIWGGTGWNSSVISRWYNQKEQNNIVRLGLNKNLLGGTFSTGVSHNSAAIDRTLEHNIYWSKFLAGWQFSSSLDWLPFDKQELTNFYSAVRWPQKYATYNESRIDYRPLNKHKLSLRHQLSWRHKYFDLQFGGSINDGGEWTVNFGISGDIEYDPFTPEVNFYRPRGGNIANIQALTYLDNNRNSVFDEEDEVLSEVALAGNQAWRAIGTNAEGHIQLYTNTRNQSIHIDEASLADPFMHPVDELVYVNTHRGGINRVALPVVTFNDLEGAIYRVKNSTSRGVNGLKVMLVDEALKVVAETTTEVDGFFFFTRIPPGQYNLQLEAEYLSANKLIIANLPEMINAPQRGDSLRINDLLLVDQEQAPELIAQAQSDSIAGPMSADKFYVQLGAFKKPRSIIEVIKYLPTEEYDLKIYRNHRTALSYVVMGGYDSLHEAREAIVKIRNVSQFTEAYVNNGSRYFQAGWTLEYQLHDIQSHLLETHELINTAPEQSYFCQLASYRSLTSIAQDKFNGVLPVYVARRTVKQARFYTLYSGPVLDPLACADEKYAELTPEQPIPLSTIILRTQLVDNTLPQ